MRPIATDVTRSVVCVSVCWAHGWASRGRLGSDSCGSKEPCITWGQVARGNGHFWEVYVPAIVKYGTMRCGRVDETTMRTFAHHFWHLIFQ